MSFAVVFLFWHFKGSVHWANDYFPKLKEKGLPWLYCTISIARFWFFFSVFTETLPLPHPSLLTWNLEMIQLSMTSSIWIVSQRIWPIFWISLLWKISMSRIQFHLEVKINHFLQISSAWEILWNSHLTLPLGRQNTDQDFLEQFCHRASCCLLLVYSW